MVGSSHDPFYGDWGWYCLEHGFCLSCLHFATFQHSGRAADSRASSRLGHRYTTHHRACSVLACGGHLPIDTRLSYLKYPYLIASRNDFLPVVLVGDTYMWTVQGCGDVALAVCCNRSMREGGSGMVLVKVLDLVCSLHSVDWAAINRPRTPWT